MKARLLAFCFLLMSLICSANDSIRVSICTHSNSIECNGFDRYSTTVQRYNPDGTLKSELEYRFRTCPAYPPDTTLVLESSVFYQYDSAHHLIDNERFWEGGTYESHWVYLYNSNGVLFDFYVEEGVPGSALFPNSHDSTVFDLSNRQVWRMNLKWNVPNQLWDTSFIYSWSYDTSGNQTYELYRQVNQQGVLDTIHAYYWAYDSLDRIDRLDFYTNNFSQRSHKSFVYDAFSNIIEEYAYDTWSHDSTLQIKSYTPSNKKQETIFQVWDTLSSVWNYDERLLFGYDAADSLFVEYTFLCPDTTCSDTANIRTYQYDIFHHILSVIDSVFDSTGVQVVHHSVSRVYDANGNLITADYPGDGGHCSGSEHYAYAYNSLNQVIHEHHTRYTCDMWEDDCYYYSLTGDSMLVDLYYTFNWSNAICYGDTIYPGVTVLGGTPPYTYQWSPSFNVLNPTLNTTGIVADSIPFILYVTDSLGNTQSDSLKFTLFCSVTGVSEMSSRTLDIYPNPFHDKVFVDPKFSKVILYDLQGREILRSRIENGIINIDRQRMNSGFYFLKIFDDSGFERVVKILAD